MMELERKGVMELFAGDCPLGDIDAVLGTERHYTVCRYMQCLSCGAVYLAGGGYDERRSGRPAVGLV
ncbi:hypothetical protein [Enterocloster clostridioformis]|uniref:hypothetical protein n=1 Tax=Enterocloster clostridioformis TaxID=1531 RepID=UPI00325C0972